MDEIENIFWERNSDITLLNQLIDKHHKKGQFLEKQRNRVQRENWIMKILKPINHFTEDYRKFRSIYDSISRMMRYFISGFDEGQSNDILESQTKFIEKMTGLFLKFFEESQMGDLVLLKKLIRPSNTKIIFDLIKFFLQAHRYYYKAKISEVFDQQKIQRRFNFKSIQLKRYSTPTYEKFETHEVEKKKSVVEEECQKIKKPKEKEKSQQKQKEKPKEKQKREDILSIEYKIKYTNFEKYIRFTNTFKQAETREKVNDFYQELLEKNEGNRQRIRKFTEKCLGKSKNLDYDVSTLYTNKQLREMQEQEEAKLHEEEKEDFQSHLKEYFKVRAELAEKAFHFQMKHPKAIRVVPWLPIVLQIITQNRKSFLLMMIEYRNEVMSVADLWETHGINVKSLVQMCAKKLQPFKKDSHKDHELKYFQQHTYLDINGLKRKQILGFVLLNSQREKRELVLPTIRRERKQQQTEIKGLEKYRSLSECKLAPIFKNPNYSHNYQQKNASESKKPLQRRISIATLNQASTETGEEKNKKARGNSRIDGIIQSIMEQRNLKSNF